ncbi:oligosaccharide flippase family protein [Granulicella sp. L60]|uniref:oligosaccharide flippase family protein n=1 Tax=Granulicella sp. L60 TaxID=1641866 RepID=UPI00131AC972|nr:oligosaccharide flippase family protein [Granulicella sp. L60]
MKAHVSNAVYGVLEYAAYPIAMLLTAPILINHLGVAQYGIWVVISAAVSTGSIIASGFGDANIQYVASMASLGDSNILLRAVRSMLGINLLLGGLLAIACWILVPFAVIHLAPSDDKLQKICLWSLRIASFLILARAIESVCISTQRAFQRYGAAVRISICGRLLTLGISALLVLCRRGVISIMIAAAVIMILGTTAQLLRLQQHLGADSLWPTFDRKATSALFSFGTYSWLLAVASVIFSQADRLILGISLGAATVTTYALCVQLAQPIYGISASGLHFLFPYLSGRKNSADNVALGKTIVRAFSVNLFLVSLGTVVVLFFGRPLLNAWVGGAIAQGSAVILVPIVWSFALLGLSVTGYYSLLALGRVHVVTWINLTGGLAMLLLMSWLLPRTGVHGIAFARLCYALVTLTMYYPLIRLLRKPGNLAVSTVCEGA